MIAENIAVIRKRIDAAARAANRDPGDITLVAATKTQSADAVREAIRAGVDACGENRVQEMLVKLRENAYEGAPLHFIGHLQSNKVKDVVGRVDLIQSVDSLKLAQLIDKTAEALNIKQNILLEVKFGDEPAKSGFNPDTVINAFEEITRLRYICVCGLMTIPPIVPRIGVTQEFFSKLSKIYVDIRTKLYDNSHVHTLSMGMSEDYEAAIACGATMVRIGTAVFGNRLS